jgi:hypothetical protein
MVVVESNVKDAPVPAVTDDGTGMTRWADSDASGGIIGDAGCCE